MRSMTAALDGNAIGGLLIEVFGTEMTTATGICAACGAASRWPNSRCTGLRSAPWCAAVCATPC